MQESKVRIGNIASLMGRPFQHLRELSFVHYQEYAVGEAAHRFVEGELDVALIPVTTFAMHGNYIGLDFGMACEGSTNLLRLFAHRPIEELDTIFVYQDSSASTLLLRLLLLHHWKSNPRIITVAQDYLPSDLMPSEGLLLNLLRMKQAHLTFSVQEDLVQHWYTATQHPFVFLIWATRPDVLTGKQHQLLYEALYRCSRSASDLLQHVEETLPLEAGKLPTLYLSEYEKQGLELAFQGGFSEKLLPEVEYQPCRLTLFHQSPRYFVSEKGIEHILGDVIDGARLTVRDGLRLAEKASLADLSLAVEAQQGREITDEEELALYLEEGWSGSLAQTIDMVLKVSQELRVTRIVLPCPLPESHDFESLCYSIQEIYRNSQFLVEGFGAQGIITLASEFGLPIRDVCSAFVEAGLQVLALDEGDLLPESSNTADWLRVVKWFHRYAGRTRCGLKLLSRDSWETRILHLQQLRALQDLNPGFESFVIGAPRERSLPLDLRIRSLLIGKLFLDNVPVVEYSAEDKDLMGEYLACCFGVRRVRRNLSLGLEGLKRHQLKERQEREGNIWRGDIRISADRKGGAVL